MKSFVTQRMYVTYFVCFHFHDSVKLWISIKHLIAGYRGDSEKFHSQFFGLLLENLPPNMLDDYTVTNILMQEVVIPITNHLNDSACHLVSTEGVA